MWLVTLYGFLVGTSVLALASVLVLGRSIRRGLRLALLLTLPTWLAVNVVFAYAVHRTAYAIESRDPFCVSCHLHESEFERFHDRQSAVAPDLAGYHSRHGENFTCITCHVGEGIDGRARVLFFAAMDVAKYTGGNFAHELDGMKHPLMDASCTKCHEPAKPGGFHASPKHAAYTSACLGCHLAHAKGDEAFGFIDYMRWPRVTAEPCLPCHPALLG
jgi:hypothetical protein